MTVTSYGAATAFTKIEEGDYSDDPKDSGNYVSGITGDGPFIGSRWGCGAPATAAWLAENMPETVLTASFMKNLPETVYDGMAESAYWTPLQCNVLPTGIDLSCFDFGWNTGISSAAKRLQWLVGATQDGELGPATLNLIDSCQVAPIAKALSSPDAMLLQSRLGVTADGSVGPKTLAALAAQPKIRPLVILLGLGEAQSAYYKTLSNFNKYGTGWLARTEARTAAGIALATASVALPRVVSSLDRSPRAIEPLDALPWHPFEPDRPILEQAARIAS
jgi:lysozyme family protein